MSHPSKRPLTTEPTRPPYLGRYEILGELGSGGMATVYLGRSTGQAGFEKLVAIKAIHPHLAADRRFVDMFLDEARLTARCTHPNVCAVFEVGQDRGRHFLAMELLEGQSLVSVIQALHFSPAYRQDPRFYAIAARLIAQAARGLHAAHELVDGNGRPLGVIHRDATPHNLFVTYAGIVKVVDFGVAKATGRLHQTEIETQTAKGKLAYMAPEQIRQQTIDRRVDVWALGASLWELLVGERLFHRDNPGATLHAVLKHKIPAPSERRPRVPALLDAIVRRSLVRDPEQRFGSALELALALESFADGVGLGASECESFITSLFADRISMHREQMLALPPVPDASGIYPLNLGTGPTAAPAPVPKGTRRVSRWLFFGALAGAGITLLVAGWLGATGPTRSRTAAPKTEATEAPSQRDREPTYDGPEAGPETPAAPAPSEANGAPSRTPATNGAPPRTPVTAEAAAANHRRRGSVRHRNTPPAARHAVSVTTPGGWADLVIDGRPAGRTPIQVQLPAGRHRVILLPFGDPASRVTRRLRVPSSSRLVVPL